MDIIELERLAVKLNEELAGVNILEAKILKYDVSLANPVTLESFSVDEIKGVIRAGRSIAIFLKAGHALIFLMDKGGEFSKASSSDAIFFLSLSSGETLFFIDKKERRSLDFQYGGLVPGITYFPELDPFRTNAKHLSDRFRQYKGCVNKALLDKNVLLGLDQGLVSDLLFLARINPRKKAKDLTKKEINLLAKKIKGLLDVSMKEEGPRKPLIYGEKTCPHCHRPIRSIRLNGKKASYCPACQKLEGVPTVISVTGPIHSGKTTAAKYLSEKGYPLFDCDEQVLRLYNKPEIADKICRVVGEDISTDKHVDKRKLSPLMKDPDVRKKVTDYLYPLLRKEALNFLRDNASSDKVIFEIPLYVGSRLEDLTDYLILVTSPIEIRKKRIEEEGRDSNALLRINELYPLRETEKAASYIIDNSKGLKELFAKLDKLKA